MRVPSVARVVVFVGLFSLPLAANAVNPPLSFTGGFSEPNCTQCHTGTVNPSGGSVAVVGAPAVYTPGSTIPIQVQIVDASAASWGFELSARFTNGSQAGSFTPNSTVSVRTGSWDGFAVQYASQGTAAVQTGSSFTFTVNWTAPADSTGGEIVFDAAGMAATSDPGTPGGRTYITEVRLAAGAPLVNAGGVVSAASFQGPLAGGELVSIFGANLTTGGPYAAAAFPLPMTLGSTDVRLNSIQCPLLYVSTTQINLQVPYGLSSNGSFPLVVGVNSLISAAQQLTFSETAPSIFNSAGTGAILHANYSAVSASNPATPGEIVLIFATGLGETVPPSTAGAAATSGLVTGVSVTIGGVTADVSYAGVAPGYAGLYQVNTTVPVTNPPLSGNVEVLLTAGAVTSPSGVTITVQ
jgi:uncharacterized protein (TIGR03437 family)